MTTRRDEAEPIARLLGSDRQRTVGWVYLWNTSELSILWIDRRHPPKHVDPPVPRDILARAKAVTTDAVTDLLEKLNGDGRAKNT